MTLIDLVFGFLENMAAYAALVKEFSFRWW